MNIHIIPTDKPSRLYYNKNGRATFSFCETIKENTPLKPCCNIYITSDEEIKFNDYITDGYKVWQWKDDSSLLGRKKIILTTDVDLIKDGVQAIDDEFLEWFVKNPSCEFVETKLFEFEVDMGLGKSCIEYGNYYKIIIPKEELDYTALLQQVGTKQETLEEAAENYVKDSSHHLYQLRKQCFLDGAKWQQEQNKNKYGEEEVLELLHKRIRYTLGEDYREETTLKWFEQFKKK